MVQKVTLIPSLAKI